MLLNSEQAQGLAKATIKSAAEDLQVESKYIEHFIEVIGRISRTCRGISDTSTSCDKEKLLFEGEELVKLSINNLRVSLRDLLSGEEPVLNSPAQVLRLIEGLAKKINHGLVELDRPIYRSWETGISIHVLLENLEKAVYIFCEEFAERFTKLRDKAQSIAFAAWIEKSFNTELHPLADGCGRVSKLLAAFILARAGLNYPNFQSRQEYFENIVKPLSLWRAFYAGKIESIELK